MDLADGPMVAVGALSVAYFATAAGFGTFAAFWTDVRIGRGELAVLEDPTL
jgi:hypothetical protein